MSTPTGVQPVQSEGKKLSTYMVASIAMLSIVGFVSILLILFGDFEDKTSRVFCTFVAFAIFTLFTAMDTSVKRPVFSMPATAFFNILILSLSLAAIWLGLIGNDEDYYSYYGGGVTFFQVIAIAIIGRLGSMAVQKSLEFTALKQSTVNLASMIAAASFGITTILFTVPIGFHRVEFGTTYWKIAVAFVLLAGLTASILSLLLWFYREEGQNPFVSPAQKAQKPKPVHYPQGNFPVENYGSKGHRAPFEAGTHSQQTNPVNGQQTPAVPPVPPVPTPVTHQVSTEASQHTPAMPPAPPAPAPVTQEKFQPPAPELLPWPLFPNGQPLPALQNGQPDFNAVQQFMPPTQYYRQ